MGKQEIQDKLILKFGIELKGSSTDRINWPGSQAALQL